MDKFLLDRGTEALEYTSSTNLRRQILFPICLEIKDRVDPERPCRDFTLCISVGGLFIMTEEPFKAGERIRMVFCIPPDIRKLGEFDGKVMSVNTDDPRQPRGIFVKFINCGAKELFELEDLIEERAHLLDYTI